MECCHKWDIPQSVAEGVIGLCSNCGLTRVFINRWPGTDNPTSWREPLAYLPDRYPSYYPSGLSYSREEWLDMLDKEEGHEPL